MAFRMSDFGIPNYDTNVNVKYKNAVEHGESIPCGDEEYIRYRMSGTPLVVVLRFAFEKDGETPKNVIAHTFLENDVRWQSGVAESSGSQARVDRAGNTLTAELVNPGAAGQGYSPMLYVDSVRFGKTREDLQASIFLQEGILTPDPKGGVQLLARVKKITPVMKSQLWLFSAVELALDAGSIFVPVSRDIMEKQLAAASVADLCVLTGQLSLLKDWQ